MNNEDPGLLELVRSGSKYIIGVDEVGLGSWAGPLVVAAVVAKRGWAHPDVRDSKRYNNTKSSTAHQKRVKAMFHINAETEMLQLKSVPVETIDEKGIDICVLEAMRAVIRSCVVHYPDSVIVVDGNTTAQQIGDRWTFDAKFISLPSADDKVPAVSAASVAAKVYRDDMMHKMSKLYPGYGFERNVGYGTDEHKKGLKEQGVCMIHRRSYRPIKRYLAEVGAW